MGCTLIQCQRDRLKLGVIEKNYKACKEQLTIRNRRIQELELLALNFLEDSHHTDGCRPSQRAKCICGRDKLSEALK